MKLATILVPAYLPRPYAGATPAPYQSSTVDAFEKKLVELSPFTLRNANVTRLKSDIAGRFVHQEILMSYTLLHDPETTTLADAIALALKTFNVEKVAVTCANTDAEDIDAAGVQELSEGLHPWSGEA